MIDVAIIGAGPAGMTAAIYAVRKELKTRIFEKKTPGGNTAEATIIDNYPGLYGLSGLELSQKMEEHLKKFGLKIETGKEVLNAEKTENGFLLEVKGNETEKVEAKTIIFATGSTHRTLNVPGEKELFGRGVSYCATCDGPIFKGKPLAVIGGGNSGATNALFLAELASKVTLIEYNEKLKAEQIYCKQLKEQKVDVLLNKKTTRILGENKVEGIEFEDRTTREKKTLPVAGVFVYVGLQPHNEIARQLGVELTEYGFIKIDRETFMTSVPGVFAAGDIAGSFAQTVVACGEGAWAAVSAYNYIKGRKEI